MGKKKESFDPTLYRYENRLKRVFDDGELRDWKDLKTQLKFRHHAYYIGYDGI